MIGDFNEIMSNKEKLGGPYRVESSFQDFKNMLSSCDMHELGGTRNSFTSGGTRNEEWIQCKLDRCFGNHSGFLCFLIHLNGFWRNLDLITDRFW